MKKADSVFRSAIKYLLGTGVLLAASASSFAQTPISTLVPVPVQELTGYWKITFYLEPSHSTGATQCLAFTKVPNAVLGHPVGGTWFAPSFSGWRGQWFQDGDHFQFYGITGSLGTAEFGSLISPSIFSGDFAHFISPNGTSSSAGSYQATRVNSCAGYDVPTVPKQPTSDPTGLNK